MSDPGMFHVGGNVLGVHALVFLLQKLSVVAK